MIAQSRSNAVTRDAICTWVARLRPSDRGAIAVITCAGTPTLIPRCGAHGVAFSWRVDRSAAPGRRANCCCAASAHPVSRGEPGAAGGLRAALFPGGACAQVLSAVASFLGAAARESTANALAPSLGTGDTSAMAAAKRKPAAKKPAAKKAAAKKPAVKKPARARVDLHCSSSRHPSFSTHRPRRSRRRRSA